LIPAVVVPLGEAGAAYDKAATTILCDCGCHPQSVKECACSRAEKMRVALASEAQSGKSGDAIIAGYVAKYGQKILISPEVSGFNLVAWFAPGFGLLLAAAGLVVIIRRWNRRPDPAAGGAPPAGPGATPDDEAYRVRLRRNLEDLR
jgi:cytochrome c-type biogenesis protein CcmH